MGKGEFLHMTDQSLQALNHQKKEELWASRIQQCRESGLGVQAWCAEQGLMLASGVHDHKVSGKTSQLLSEYNEPKKSK